MPIRAVTLPTRSSSSKPITSPSSCVNNNYPPVVLGLEPCAQALNGEPVMIRVAQAGETNSQVKAGEISGQVKAGEMKTPDIVVFREAQPLNR